MNNDATSPTESVLASYSIRVDIFWSNWMSSMVEVIVVDLPRQYVFGEGGSGIRM